MGSFSVKGQQAELDILSAAGGDVHYVTPETEYTFEANVFNLPTNHVIVSQSYKWAISGDDATFPATSSRYAAITWKNLPNSPQKWVDAEVRIRNGNNATTYTIERRETVIVRYLGPITQMTISGANPANPTSGGTVTLPCGIQSVSTSVNSVATDPPSSVTYAWSFPSGWSGSGTTSTPNRTATSNAGQNDGQITVGVRRNDSNFERFYNVNVSRPRVGSVTITPETIITLCNSSQAVNLTANAANATIFNWTASGGALIQSGQSSATATIKATSNGSVTATADNACQSPQYSSNKQIYFGPPTISSNTVNGAPAQSINFITNPAYLVTTSATPGVSYNWSIFNGTGSIYPSGNTCVAYANPFIRVQVQTQSSCGNGQAYTYYLYQSGSMFRVSSANPMDDLLTLEFEDADLANQYLESVELSSATQRGLRVFNGRKAGAEKYFDRMKQVSFDVANLQPGPYFLTVQIAGQKFSETLMKR